MKRKSSYIPYVIEPSLGADRVALGVPYAAAYDEEEHRNRGETRYRTVLRFHPAARTG